MLLKYSNYQNNIPEGYIDKTIPLFVNSCGTYQLFAKDHMTTERPFGRNDYQLIYLASGKGTFYFDGTTPTSVKAGHIVIYPPHTMQKYSYDGKDTPHIYWIHFSGSSPDIILDTYGFSSTSQTYFVGSDSEYLHIFDSIIFELQCKKPFYTDCAATLFKELLIAFGRFHVNHTLYRKPLSFHRLDKAAAYFHTHFNENIDIETYIKEYEPDLCISLFYRQFKEYCGQSPLQYILDIRLSTAKKMLETTNCSIQEIAHSVGYENALYFSRLFRKHTGFSPKEYRAGHGLLPQK